MKIYHVQVEQDEGWFVGRVLEREGITTQGRSLDELIYMVRDAIELMWDETAVHLELIVPAEAVTSFERRRRAARATAKAAPRKDRKRVA